MGDKIYLASSNIQLLTNLKNVLLQGGLQIAGQAKDGMTVLRQIRMTPPDLTVIDTSLDALDGLKVAEIVSSERLSPLVLLIEPQQQDLLTGLIVHYQLPYLVKPVNEQNLLALIRQILFSQRTIHELEEEVKTLKEQLESRKVIERAKGLLMKQLKISEDEAFKRMRKQSMDRRMSMKQVAEAIIMAFELQK